MVQCRRLSLLHVRRYVRDGVYKYFLVAIHLTNPDQLNTTHGPIKLEIFCEAVPKASENFLALCASGRYDGSAVHRILKDFIMQAGAPAGDSKAKVRKEKVVRLLYKRLCAHGPTTRLITYKRHATNIFTADIAIHIRRHTF
jgi:hypothetical protein